MLGSTPSLRKLATDGELWSARPGDVLDCLRASAWRRIEGHQLTLLVRNANAYRQPERAKLSVLKRVVVRQGALGQHVCHLARPFRVHVALEQA